MSSVYGLCPHEDDPSLCPPCNTDHKKIQPIVGYSFRAKYSGKCISGDEIFEGDSICYYEDLNYEGYSHLDCLGSL